MSWFLKVLKLYAVFSGRARRKEYWFFVLFYLIFGLALHLIDQALGIYDAEFQIGLLEGLYSLALLIPSLAVGARRLHDTDRSAWWLLLLLVPILGWIVLIVFMALRGQEGGNRFGPDPIASA